MQIVSTSIVTNTAGFTRHMERGAAVKRVEVNYQHVREPVAVPRPKIEDFTALVVVHDKVEYYS
ncbi:MAG: hypothetical protein LBD04_05150 [Synergistaceae bacterium]|nr:hypothetical protein [Synergistaceae bacterium]